MVVNAAMCEPLCGKMSRQVSSMSSPAVSRQGSTFIQDAVSPVVVQPEEDAAAAVHSFYEPTTALETRATSLSPPTKDQSADDDCRPKDEARPAAPAAVDAQMSKVTSAQIVAFLSQCLDSSVDRPVPVGCHFVDIFTLKAAPYVGLPAFIERVLIRRLLSDAEPHVHDPDFAASGSESSSTCTHTGATVRLSPFNVHRLFAAALTLAIKSTQDVYHPMSFYGAVYGLTALDVRRLERALMVLLRHRLFVTRQDATDFLAIVN